LFETLRINATGYVDTPAEGKDTRTWGLESQARRGPFELLFEFADRRAADNGRGAYLQPSYRLTDRWTLFYRYDRLSTTLDGETQANTAGVHLRPITPVSLKFEFFSSTHSATRRFYGLATSFAVAF
jgi:phosphate-selective porin